VEIRVWGVWTRQVMRFGFSGGGFHPDTARRPVEYDPFIKKSTCLHPINLRAVCGVNFVTSPPKLGVHETLVLHQVDCV